MTQRVPPRDELDARMVVSIEWWREVESEEEAQMCARGG